MKEREDTVRRMDEVRELLRARHARVSPDDGFAERVARRAVRDPLAPFAWASARLLPASAALAAVLLVAVLVTGTGSTTATATASTTESTSASTGVAQNEFDPVSWVFEGSAR